MRPLVSVIMPAYNAGKYISEAIRSVIDQTYTNWELIIVEDKSDDDTLDVIESFQDEHIILLRNDRNKGIAYSSNRAIDRAKGKYIALLDDDDVAMSERLRLQVDFMEKHENIDIAGGRSVVIDAEGNELRKGDMPRNNPKYNKAILLFRCGMGFMNSTAMIRREFIQKHNLRYQENCYGMQDYKFYIDSSKVGNISSIDEYILKQRLHDKNESLRRQTEYGKERAETYARFQDESLAASGFKLSDESLQLIHKALAEFEWGCDSVDELRQLYEVFNDMARQGRRMNIDYQEELEIVLKTLIGQQIKKLDIFQ